MERRVPTPEAVLDLAHRLKEAKARVAELQADWDELFNPTIQRANRPDKKAAIGDLVLDLLNSHVDTAYSTFEIAAQLGANRNSVGPTLSRLVSEGKIEKRGHGIYGAIHTHEKGDLFISREESPDAA